MKKLTLTLALVLLLANPGFGQQDLATPQPQQELQHQVGEPHQVLELGSQRSDTADLTVRQQPQRDDTHLKTLDARVPDSFRGCWEKVITRFDVRSIQATGSVRLGNWFNEKYRICFSEGGLTVNAEELSEEFIVYSGTPTAQILQRSDDSLSARVEQSWDDMDTHKPSNAPPSPLMKPLPHPYHVDQTTMLSARLEEDQLRVEAAANALVDSRPGYTVKWSADFHRVSSF